jgi:hypothetical protein
MKRKALLRDGDKFSVLEEGDFPGEVALQEALKRNPEVIPVADLELDEVVVVGRETPVPVGAIDLLLVDAEGQVIIVETKLSRNPELRRQVVAQVLDYGAGLWRAAPTLRQFEELVLRYWRSAQCEDERVKGANSLREGLEPILRDLRSEDWEYEAFEHVLAENLRNGQHVLLVIASGLMDGLSRDLLRYANLCLDMPLYGVEVDVFETEGRQLIVPRGVRYTAKGTRRSRGRVDRAAFLSSCTTAAADFFAVLLDEAEQRGMIINWGVKGFSVRLPLVKPISVMYGMPPDELRVYTGAWRRGNKEPSEFRKLLVQRAPFKPRGPLTNTLNVDEETRPQADAALAFVWEEVDKLIAAADQDG